MNDALDTLTRLITLIAAVWALIATIRGNKKVDALKVEVDGRLTQFIEASGREQRGMGRAEGIEAERVRPQRGS